MKTKNNSKTQNRLNHLKITLVLLIALAGVAVGGCVSAAGQKKITNQDVVNQIVVGKSTKADVKALLGEPANALPYGDNDEMWMYHYTRGERRATSFIPYAGAFIGGADSKMATLTVRFGSDGIVKYVGKGSMTGGGGGIQDSGR